MAGDVVEIRAAVNFKCPPELTAGGFWRTNHPVSMNYDKFWLGLVAILCAVGVGGCVTQRTVTQGGSVKPQSYVVKRPLQGGN